MRLLLSCVIITLLRYATVIEVSEAVSSERPEEDHGVRHRLKSAKLDWWSRGAFALDEQALLGDSITEQQAAQWMEQQAWRLGPIKRVRQQGACGQDAWWQLRGGAQQAVSMEDQIQELGVRFGPDFLAAIRQNTKEHAEDCEQSCESYYCASSDTPTPPLDDILDTTQTHIQSYSMGAVPPEDFSADFGFPLDLIKVTQGKGLFSKDQARRVIQTAVAEGVDQNEYRSGKYQLGGDWLTNLPQTRAWFNALCESTLFPLIANLFPSVVSSPAVLRAHSVSLLKYNASHPRTDVHIDNGILAMTLAMTPQDEYEGGGTFFEHFLNNESDSLNGILPMDVGHGTFRPGSVRHGGHCVIAGTRYILGAFLLIEDRVEHVRRLKNRGAELRRAGQLQQAEQHFAWALALNPKCTTCLKDWAEILLSKKDFIAAEAKIRAALELLENKDSDALFTLGLILSEQGRDDESIAAYQQSVQLNAEDAELLYNLGIKLGTKGNVAEEMQMYDRCTQVDAKFGPAWLNWGTSLAVSGRMDEAEQKFVQALLCPQIDVPPMAMINLARVYIGWANELARSGDLGQAETVALQASQYLDTAKPLLESLQANGNDDASRYLVQFRPLRLQSYQTVGQVYAGKGDLTACETEFRKATESFPEEPPVWQMLSRVLQVQGKTEEAQQVLSNIQQQ